MKSYIEMLTDSYKFTHHKMYPAGTQTVYSYWEARDGAKYDETVFFGLQYFIKEYLMGPVVTREGIERAAQLSEKHFGNKDVFNRKMWEYILAKYDGRLPIRIKAVAEGTPVPVGNVMMTIENTDPECFALTNHMETLLCQMWAPSTVATMSREAKKLLKRYLEKTADTLNMLPFQLHDFGYRGVSSVESAGTSGAGHLVNFMGTDTVRAMEVAMDYYMAGLDGLAYSVPASEHSVMTSLGRMGEAGVVKQILDAYPTGIVSIVADSYNVYNFTENIIGGTFKEQILARDGKVVVRPDSGDPELVVAKLIEILGKQFGYTKNAKGYKVLNPKVGLLWGDGIDVAAMQDILGNLCVHGWSTENIVFGMGGGLLQKVNRDTQRFAFKSSAQKRNGEWFDIQKDPVDGKKKSKRGRLVLLMENNNYYTNRVGDRAFDREITEDSGILQTVFENGVLVKEYTFDEVRKNAEL